MFRRRWVLLGLVVSLTLAVVGLTFALRAPPPGVTRANFRQIHRGMTLAEVEARMGGWPTQTEGFPFPGLRDIGCFWQKNGGWIYVELDDANGRVKAKHWLGPKGNLVDRLSDWLAGS